MLADKAHNAKDFDVPREPLNVTPGKTSLLSNQWL